MIAKKRQKNYYFQPKLLPIPKNKKLGRILYDIPHFRYAHEKQAVQILAKFGYDITFVKPSELSNVSTPDFRWQRKYWELKTIFKSNIEAVEGDLKNALSQCNNIILDATKTRRGIEQIARDVYNYLKRRGHSWNNKTILIFDKEKYCIIDKGVLQ